MSYSEYQIFHSGISMLIIKCFYVSWSEYCHFSFITSKSTHMCNLFCKVHCLLFLPVVPGVGTFIFARSASDVNRYEKAVVNEKNLKKVTVKYLNGQKTSFNIRQFDCVIWNVEPNPADLRVGSLVIASDDDSGREQIMMLGRLREIKTNVRKKTSYVVDRFDGKSIVVTLSKLRIVPEGDEAGKFPFLYVFKWLSYGIFYWS